MFIRFAISNLFSFQKETEFNLFPGRINRLGHHKYKALGIETLKTSAIYGANGAGKSNLVKAIDTLKDFVISGNIPEALFSQKFKLTKKSIKEPVYLGIEFIHKNKAYYYGIHVNDGIVLKEELLFSGLGKKEDKPIFIRSSKPDKSSQIIFFQGFEGSKENVLLKGIIEKDLLKHDKSLLTLLNGLSNESFTEMKTAFEWFNNQLVILYPKSRPLELVHNLDVKKILLTFANDIMVSFQTGVKQIIPEKKSIEEFVGEENRAEIDKIVSEVRSSPGKMIGLMNQDDEIVVIDEAGKIIAKRLSLNHSGDKGQLVPFNLNQESDGTKRLLQYIPVILDVIINDKVCFIDEMERSLHPLLVKELVRKFSGDNSTKGQLVFTTHESNLLDQDIFRQDEIWFAEKNKLGATELYPLTEFKKEHHTIDLRKGYLTGRYGAIPFLGNLSDLKWNSYAAD
ncbi:MAG: ATP-binding protein [Bacteroidales bacterium]|nr:ATP-binding protein [Bacteroidales bacterium]